MRKMPFILTCVVFALFAVTDGFAKTKWDMHLNYPAGNFHSQGAQRFADRVAEATGGELTIVLHPGAALGFKGPELLRAVAEGQLAVAEVPTGMVEGDAPVLALTAQPFMLQTVIAIVAGLLVSLTIILMLATVTLLPYSLFSVEAMKAGNKMTVEGRSGRGTVTTDEYSLSGVTAGLNAVAEACP